MESSGLEPTAGAWNKRKANLKIRKKPVTSLSTHTSILFIKNVKFLIQSNFLFICIISKQLFIKYFLHLINNKNGFLLRSDNVAYNKVMNLIYHMPVKFCLYLISRQIKIFKMQLNSSLAYQIQGYYILYENSY